MVKVRTILRQVVALFIFATGFVADASTEYRVGSDDCKKWPLHCAAALGDDYLIERLVSFGFEVESKDSSNLVPIAYAVINKHLSSIATLLRLKASPQSDAAEGQPLLHWTVHNGELAVAQVLLKGGANPDWLDKNGDRPLHVAVINSRDEMTLELLTAKAAPDAPNLRDLSPLQLAATLGLPSSCSILIANGADLERKDIRNTMTALHYAVKSRAIPVIQLLIDRGAKVNATTQNLKTPLDLVWDQEDREVIKILLGKSPFLTYGHLLMRAANDRSLEFIEWLIENGFREHVNDGYIETPLSVAISKNRLDVARVFFKIGAKAKPRDKQSVIVGSNIEFMKLFAEFKVDFNDGESLFYTLDGRCETSAAEFLLITLKIDPNKTINNGKIPLLIAIRESCEEIAKILLKSGANPNVREEKYPYYTPLMIAIAFGRAELTDALIEARVIIDDTDVKNAFSRMANHQCEEDRPRIFKALWSKLRVLKVDEDGDTFAHILASSSGASLASCLTVFQEFASVPGFLDIRNKKGDLAVHRFDSQGLSEGVDNFKIVVKGTAEKDAIGGEGGTPLQIACERHLEKQVEALFEGGASLTARGIGKYDRWPFLICMNFNVSQYQHVEFWLRNGTAPNTLDADGSTALHFAARFKTTKSALALCRAGGNVDLKNNLGESPKEIAKKDGLWTFKILSDCDSAQEPLVTLPTDESVGDPTQSLYRMNDGSLFSGGVPYISNAHSQAGPSVAVAGCYFERGEFNSFSGMAVVVRLADGRAKWGRRVVDTTGRPTHCDRGSFVVQISSGETLVARYNTFYSFDSNGFMQWQKKLEGMSPGTLVGVFDHTDTISQHPGFVAIVDKSFTNTTELEFNYFSISGELVSSTTHQVGRELDSVKIKRTASNEWQLLYEDEEKKWHLSILDGHLNLVNELPIKLSRGGTFSDLVYDTSNRILYLLAFERFKYQETECFLEAQDIQSRKLWVVNWANDCYSTGDILQLENRDFILTAQKKITGQGQFLRIGSSTPQVLWLKESYLAGDLLQRLAENIFFSARRQGSEFQGAGGTAFDLSGNIVWTP